MNEQIARYREIERRGLLNQLPEEKQALWAEIKRRGLDDPYSATEKLQYTLRAGADLPTFGTANLGAGLTNVLSTEAANVTHGKDFGERVKSAQKIVDILNPVGGWQAKLEAVRSPEFKQGRQEYIEEQKQFKDVHPWLNALGEYGIGGVVGGVAAGGKKLATEAIKQPLKEISRQSAKNAMKFGGAYGGLSSLASDPERVDVGQALLNTGLGAVGGAALGEAAPYAVGGAVKAVKGVAKPVARVLGIGAQEAEQGANVALERIVKQSPELVKKSIEEETPLINIADKKLFRTTRGAVSTDAEAEQIMADYAQKFNAQKAGKVENLINEQLGSKSSSGVTEDIIKAGRAKYQPIYEEVMKAGDLQIPIKNQRVLNAMEQVLKEYPELNNLPATDIQVLDLVKQRLDDQISVAVRKGANNQARLLSQAKNELIRDIDAKIPQYAEARKAFKSMKDLEGLVEKGRSIKQLGREELGAMYEKVAPEERAALKGGIRDVLIRDLDRINSEGANAVRKVFSPSMLNKLKRIGLSEDKIVKAVEAENLANANVQGVFGGSNTAQKIADILNNTQQLSVGRAVMSPMRTAKRFGTKAIDYLVQRIQNSSPAETARLMTDPAYLKREYERIYGGVGKALKAGKPLTNGMVETIAKKLTEESGIAWGALGSKGQKRIKDIIKAEQDKIVKGYKEVKTNPLKGDFEGKNEVLAELQPDQFKKYIIQRGAAIKDPETGDIVVQGKDLKKATGTDKNFGFSKMIFKHGITPEEAKQVPTIIREYKPYDNTMGKEKYRIKLNDKKNFLIVFKNDGENNRLITVYKEDILPDAKYSKKKALE